MDSGGITPVWKQLKREKQILKGVSVSLFLHRLTCFNHQCWWQKREKSLCQHQWALQIETNLSEPDTMKHDSHESSRTLPSFSHNVPPSELLPMLSHALWLLCLFESVVFSLFHKLPKKGLRGGVWWAGGELSCCSKYHWGIPKGDA